MTNEQLAERIKAGEDTAENMLRLWGQTKGFICAMARRYAGSVEREDLEQEGYLALYDAVKGYDPATGCRFLTYAENWIRQRIVRYIENNGSTVRIPVHERGRLQEYKKIVNAFHVHLGRRPSRREIAMNMHLSDKQVTALEKALEMAQIGSLDGYLSEDGEGGTVGDTVGADIDVEGDVIADADMERLRAVLWSMVDGLPDKQGTVLRARYQEGKTLKEAGAAVGTTVERTRRIESEALRSLRQPSRASVLYPFLDGDIYSAGIAGCGAARFATTWTSSTERAALKRTGW